MLLLACRCTNSCTAALPEMRSGTLAAGTRMPGKRRLAAELSVSVNTVDAAYQMLAAEGYLESRERSGFMYRNIWPRPGLPAGRNSPHRQNQNRLCCQCGTTFPPAGRPGAVPVPHMGAAAKELLYSSPQLLTHGDAQGDPALRQALAEYL